MTYDVSSAQRVNLDTVTPAEVATWKPGEVVLLGIGPMTNIGVLFAADPGIPALLKGLVLMCGQFFTAMGGEWNAICDPHATAIVFGEGRQPPPPRLVSFGPAGSTPKSPAR